MRRSVTAVTLVHALGMLLPAAAAGPVRMPEVVGDPAASRVVVTLRDDDSKGPAATRRAVRTAARRLGVTPSDIYASIGPVFAADVTPAQRAALETDPQVLSVESDDPVVDQETADALPAEPEAAVRMAGEVDLTDDMEATTRRRQRISGRPMREELPRQRIPVWLKRIGATRALAGIGNHKTTRPFDADVAVIDSGISRKHPDVTAAGGKDCSKSGTWGDGYGHGTGVASILGAKDNRRGIVGLLPGVRLWSVRIFDDVGRGKVSGVLCALDWMAGKKDRKHRGKPFFEGATMSFAVIFSGRDPSTRPCGEGPRDVIHKAVCKVVRQGTILVAAAGNYGDSARQRAPAAYPEVITVSAMADFDGKKGGRGRQSQACLPGSALERDDAFTSFSSYGSAVDLIAPGKCIWVAVKGGSYARVAGTSFSTPIALAVALRYRERFPSAEPNQVRMALIRAGRRDWRVGTDPDRRHEPRVDLRWFRSPPTFRYALSERRSLRRTGDGVTVRVAAHRRNGHTARIRLRTLEAPAGIRVSIDGWTVRVRATSSAHLGKQHVKLLASDGEVRRTIKLLLTVRR